MPTLLDRLIGRGKSISDRVVASGVTITGDLTVNIPGMKDSYDRVDRVEITYPSMNVTIEGTGKKDGEGYNLTSGSVTAAGKRSDPAVEALHSSKPAIVVLDPHVEIYRGGNKFVLNQVQGVPEVIIKKGRVDYK